MKRWGGSFRHELAVTWVARTESRDVDPRGDLSGVGMGRASVIGLAVGLTACCAACSGTSGKASSAADSATNTPPTVTVTVTAGSTATSTEPTSTEPTTASATTSSSSGIGKFTDTYTYKDGVKLSIVSVKRGTLSATGCCGKSGSSVAIFQFKLNNGTSKIFDATLFDATVTYGATGKTAEAAYDSERHVGDGFTQKLLPGRVAVADYAFSVPRSGMNDVVVQVDPDFNHNSAFFQDAVK
jgi:hypothetical protein